MTEIGILGAGIAGVAMGMQLRRAGVDDVTIYDKHPDVGGTWYRNTWPGLHCDIPSHLYSYSFEPNPDWSMVYSGQAEIQAYLRACAEKYGLVERTRFDTTVDSARFDEATDTWTLTTAEGDTATHRLLVSATGGLAEPALPRIDGYDTFRGPWWHSGTWRDDVDLAGKRVAVVGSAASAVTVVPTVAALAAEVFVFSRSPNWVIPRNNATYTAEHRTDFRSGDGIRRARRRQYRTQLLWYRAFKRNPAAIEQLRRIASANLRSAIDDPDLLAALTPDYDPGCKRILVSDDYYPALAEPHVHLVPHGVTALTEGAVVAADGGETEVDVVIFCTGYAPGTPERRRAALEVVGRGGRTLSSALTERPEAWRGLAVPGFPNHFTICGINGAVAYASYFDSAELATEWVARWARRIVDGEIRTVEVRPEPTHEQAEVVQAELQQMSWAGNCTNFYKDRKGRILSFFPGTVGRLRRELSDLHEDDFLVTLP